MKLYTKRGDAGSTDLLGGQRVGKNDPRVEAIGTVDELNSMVGLAVAICDASDTRQTLVDVQSRLFEIGADLAAPREPGKDEADHAKPDHASDGAGVGRLKPEEATTLERRIDEACEGVPAMQHFILPGGSELSARLHLARTVCRRAERACVALKPHQPAGDPIPIYLNRLSDLLFALARQANHRANVEDVPWIAPR